MQRMQAKKTVRGNVRLVVVSVLVTLCALELCLRVYHAYVSWRYPGEDASAMIYMYDPVLGWKMRPDAAVVFSNPNDRIRTRIRTNSRGLRDDEHAYEKKESIVRICLVGNSAIAGFEVDKKYLLGTRLGRLLNAGSPSPRFEVINFGVRGYGTDQSYLTMKSEVARYGPDMIIYVFSGNDYNDNITVRNPNRKYGKSYFNVDSCGRLELKGVPIPGQFPHPDRYLTVFNAADSPAYAPLPKEPAEGHMKKSRISLWKSVKQDLSHSALYRLARQAVRNNPLLARVLLRTKVLDDWKGAANRTDALERAALTQEGTEHYKTGLLKSLLCAMRHSADSMGAKFLVYEMSNGSGSMPKLPTMVNRLCDSCAIPYINSIPVFFQNAKGSKKFSFAHDGHWNAKGHALAAHIIYDYLITDPRFK
jgi:lysophospholipase L1-like esterase